MLQVENARTHYSSPIKNSSSTLLLPLSVPISIEIKTLTTMKPVACLNNQLRESILYFS